MSIKLKGVYDLSSDGSALHLGPGESAQALEGLSFDPVDEISILLYRDTLKKYFGVGNERHETEGSFSGGDP